ncbi:MAG: hypothetical protein ACOX6N_00780 [Patescibacteria group bacterium]|jgi:hypothetical protein
MKQILKYSLIFLFIAVTASLLVPKNRIESVPPTNIKDVLSSSQLSYFARLGTGNTFGTTLLKIQTSGNPSNTTSNLFVDDIVGIGKTGVSGLDQYTVSDIGNAATFQIGTTVAHTNSFNNTMVVATRSAVHTVYFTPKTTIAGGAWQFLIKATSRTGELAADGIPDQQGFDLGADVGTTTTGPGTRLKTADISCPFGTASVGATDVTINGSVFHSITCTLDPGVQNPIDVGVTMVIGSDLSTGSQLINPSASVSRSYSSEGVADVYDFYIRHLDSSDAVVDADTARGRIAVVESVRVTATVDPTLSFYIDNTGVGSGQNRCGNILGAAAANTTATTVAFDSLSIGSTANNLAQRLNAVTNASSGYAVTVYESDYLTNISTGTTITNTNCDPNYTCNPTTPNRWQTDLTHSGFGYSIQNINADTVPFEYNTDGAQYAAKPFGIGAANAQTIMSNAATPITTEQIYMCYRIIANTTQEAGNYETKIVYTATATF